MSLIERPLILETSSYGSSLAAERTGIEQAIDIRLTLRYLGISVRSRRDPVTTDGTYWAYCLLTRLLATEYDGSPYYDQHGVPRLPTGSITMANGTRLVHAILDQLTFESGLQKPTTRNEYAHLWNHLVSARNRIVWHHDFVRGNRSSITMDANHTIQCHLWSTGGKHID